jgi:hypothetical protein
MSLPIVAKYENRFGHVIPFKGNFTLVNEQNGAIFRCDDGSNVTVTIPRNLMEGFNVAFAQWAAGTITLSAASGAINRAGGTATSAIYQHGSLIVVKNSNNASTEFVVGGDFT